MNINFFKFDGYLIKEFPMQGYLEGLILEINQEGFPEFCNREGYTQGNKLVSHSLDYNSIGEVYSRYISGE